MKQIGLSSGQRYEGNNQKDYHLKFRRIVLQAFAQKGLSFNPDRLIVEDFNNLLLGHWVRMVVDILTQEEPLALLPKNWWEHLKADCFPRRLKKLFPVKYNRIVALHIFPELDPPDNPLGKEFVTIRIVDPEKLTREDLLD